MSYQLQDRLKYNSDRFRKSNTEKMQYLRVSGREIQISASPILISPDELTPGNVSNTMVERQDFAIDVCELQELYPPILGDKIRRRNGDEFVLVSAAEGTDEPPFVHVTSARERIIAHTVRVKRQ